jgi:CHAT domain-containing protein
MAEPISMQEATRLAGLTLADALDTLRGAKLLTPATAAAVARHSLAATETVGDVERLLALAEGLHAATGATDAVAPWLAYAQARHAVAAGDLAAAEAQLAAASHGWAQLGETLSQARSGLGLTQVLAMQGRFDAAHAAIAATIDALARPTDRSLELDLLLAAARQNLATLLSYQERHIEALAVLQTLRAEAVQWLAVHADAAAQQELYTLLGQIGIDAAVYQTYLDRPADAETTLRAAIDQLTAAGARHDRGRAHTNLGHLYTRTGRFAEALPAFDTATLDLLGTREIDAAADRWEAADVLFLEQAIAHLALNLLPEAAADLDRAIALFARSGQRYEWGQATYYRALLSLRAAAVEDARQQLATAAALFAELENHFWLNRVQIAQAIAAEQAGALDAATALLDPLLIAAAQPSADAALTWDLSTRVEAAWLALRIALQRGAVDEARRLVTRAAGWLATAAPVDALLLYPHLSLQLLHARGQVARAEGDIAGARRFFEAAVAALETQRAALPVEDFRAAFLADKTTIYADLVLALLAAPTPTADTVADVFAVVERARSRALLERLLVAVESTALAPDSPEAVRSVAVREQLTWLYNQLLREGGANRAADQAITAEIRAHEATLQRIEWQLAPWLAEAEPATLAALQQALPTTEQAIVYYCAGDEWLAFVVAHDAVHLMRRLCTNRQVESALADLRFQMGRVEIGGGHVARHAERLLRGVRGVLRRLYDLLIAPLKACLHAPQLLIVPYGALHLAPVHALWDGAYYLLEGYEIHYAPSASVEVLRRQRAQTATPTSLAAFALREPSIPQAEVEVRAAAQHFASAQLFVDDAAQLEQVRAAAASSDVLHFATHGFFRPDNPFFSALKLADGWIDVRAIYRLPLRARLVVLSACESGAVRVQGADEAVGLVRGFLGAGAQALVVSLWNVHDASAAQLMTDFYTGLMQHQMAPSAALRSAQRRAIHAARHPYFWAPYVAIG